LVSRLDEEIAMDTTRITARMMHDATAPVSAVLAFFMFFPLSFGVQCGYKILFSELCANERVLFWRLGVFGVRRFFCRFVSI
jgi:hypothetical protein